MSRTKRGNKAPGSEYWSKRPGKNTWQPGKISKRITHKAERRQRMAIAQDQHREGVLSQREDRVVWWGEDDSVYEVAGIDDLIPEGPHD